MGRFQLELFIFITHFFTATQELKNIGKILDTQKTNPNSLNMSLRKDMEWKTIEQTMSIIHLENNHRKINTLEEIEILKAASSKHLLNDIIAGQNDPIYKLLPT